MKAYGIKTLGMRNYLKILPQVFFRRLIHILYHYFHIPLLAAAIYLLFRALS